MDRPLVEVLGAVLHELRRSGPLGLHVEELQELLRSPLLGSALATLLEEGRVVVRGDVVTLSAAQRELTALRSLVKLEHDRTIKLDLTVREAVR